MTVLVFANGDLQPGAWLQERLASATAIVAADGGAAYVLAAGYWPHVVIGDLDSLVPEQRDALEEAGVTFLLHPEAKDETDLELALLHAAATYVEPIEIIAGLGGRLDQLLANVFLLLHPALRGRQIRFLTPHQTIWLVQSDTVVHGEPGDKVSLIPLGGDVHVRTATGLAWPLQDDVLTVGPARGVSNEMTSSRATVSVASGDLLCVHTTRRWLR
ncbi:MAG: thiamine diphosphokinase [Anaerolineae bacterium]|nr:thiamine diphosphokinase [Anaerolineae bacterium]